MPCSGISSVSTKEDGRGFLFLPLDLNLVPGGRGLPGAYSTKGVCQRVHGTSVERNVLGYQ